MCGLGPRRHHRVHRQDDIAAVRPGLGADPGRGLRHPALAERGADVDPAGVKEGVGHAAADHQLVHLGAQITQQIQFGRNLGPADDGGKGALR